MICFKEGMPNIEDGKNKDGPEGEAGVKDRGADDERPYHNQRITSHQATSLSKEATLAMLQDFFNTAEPMR